MYEYFELFFFNFLISYIILKVGVQSTMREEALYKETLTQTVKSLMKRRVPRDTDRQKRLCVSIVSALCTQ